MKLLENRGKTRTDAYRPELDGVRAIAIVSVLCFHVGFKDWQGGFIGVDVFFVLSGFLICGHIYQALQAGSFSVADFFARRIRRLAPAALACYLAVTAAVAALFLPWERADYIKSLIGSVFFFNNVLLANSTGYFAPDVQANPLMHTWSLSIEEQFYLATPLIVVLLGRRPGPFVAAMVVAFAAPLAAMLFFGETLYSSEARYFAALFRVWEIALGGLAYVLASKVDLPRLPGAPVVGLLAVAAPIFLIKEKLVYPGPITLLVAVGTVLLILFARPERSRVGRALGAGVCQYIGRISYSTYLWHWPLIVFWKYFGNHMSDGVRAGLVFASLALGALSYHVVEAPARRVVIPAQNRKLFGLFSAQASVLSACALALWVAAPREFDARYQTYQALVEAGKVNPRWHECWFHKNQGCRFGVAEGSGRPVFVWGDSMPNSALPAFEAIATQRQAPGLLISSGTCPPLKDMASAKSEPSPAACIAINRTALDILNAAPPSDVYLFARWSQYALGETKVDPFARLGIAGKSREGMIDQNAARLIGKNMEFVRRGLADLLGAIDPKHRVVVIGPTPDFDDSVPRMMIRAMQFNTAVEPLKTADFLKRMGLTRDMLREVAHASGADFIDPTSAFCAGQTCLIANPQGMPVYFDHCHLSGPGNDLLQGLLQNLDRQRTTRAGLPL